MELCASKKGETFFYCTVCAIDIACAHGGKSDVRRKRLMMQITRLIQYYGFCGTNEFGKNDVCSSVK
jgi:hypothetical protein